MIRFSDVGYSPLTEEGGGGVGLSRSRRTGGRYADHVCFVMLSMHAKWGPKAGSGPTDVVTWSKFTCEKNKSRNTVMLMAPGYGQLTEITHA